MLPKDTHIPDRSVRMAYVAVLAWLSLGLCAPVAAGGMHIALIVNRLTNVTDKKAARAHVSCLLPASNDYQQVDQYVFDPQPAKTKLDSCGQPVVEFVLGPIAPGQTQAIRIMTWVQPRPRAVSITKPLPAPVPLSEDRKRAFVADGPAFELDKVRPVAERAAGGQQDPIAAAKLLLEYMEKECSYDLDTYKDPAGEVLQRGTGSCSELALVFVALCRARGIPARPVTAFCMRRGTQPSIDWRNHRWAEFYADRYGWIPVDPTHQLTNPDKGFFGRQDAKYLVMLDDGSDQRDYPGWRVVTGFAEPDDAKLRLHRSCAWRRSLNRKREAEFFAEACQALRLEDPQERISTINRWHKSQKPLRFAFFVEALHDEDATVRLQAARLIENSNDPSVTLVLAKMIEQESDDAVKTALMQAIRKLCSNPAIGFRTDAIESLAKSRAEAMLPLLLDAAEDVNPKVRKAIAATLYKFGDRPEVHAAYRYLVRDRKELTRLVAARRWARIGSMRAGELLLEFLSHSRQRYRQWAIVDLRKLAGREFGFDPRLNPKSTRNRQAIRKWRDWLDGSAGGG